MILHRESPAAIERLLKKHGHPDLDGSQTTDALRLLEMQQDAMLMFTSCGWFFDDISGLETVQCLQYAARAIALARQFNRDLEPAFARALAAAPSNLAEFGDGKGVWERIVRPSVVDLDRVLAHHAISLIYRPMNGEATRKERVHAYDLEVLEQDIRARRQRPPGRRPDARTLTTDLAPGGDLFRGGPLRRARLPRGALERAWRRNNSRRSGAGSRRPIGPGRWPTS